MGGACSSNGDKRNTYRLLVGKPEARRPLGRPRRRCLDNIRTDLVEVGWGEFGIEPSSSIKCWKTIECPNNLGSLE
jgi:hypothetical protein